MPAQPPHALPEGLQGGADKGQWQPDAASEARRQRLLPTLPPLAWDELMRDPVYHQALTRLP